MSTFVLRNLKVYEFNSNLYVVAFKGKDNNISGSADWTITVTEDIKYCLNDILGNCWNKIAFNSSDREDIIEGAIKTIGNINDFEKVNLEGKVNTRFYDDKVEKIIEKRNDIFEINNIEYVENSKGKYKIYDLRVIDNKKYILTFGDDSLPLIIFSVKNVRETVRTYFRNRNITITLEKLIRNFENLEQNKFKLKFLNNNYYKTAYLFKNKEFGLLKRKNANRGEKAYRYQNEKIKVYLTKNDYNILKNAG